MPCQLSRAGRLRFARVTIDCVDADRMVAYRRPPRLALSVNRVREDNVVYLPWDAGAGSLAFQRSRRNAQRAATTAIALKSVRLHLWAFYNDMRRMNETTNETTQPYKPRPNAWLGFVYCLVRGGGG